MAVLGDVLALSRPPSHAYLLHGPGGAGKRAVARALAAELLAEGEADPVGARARVASGAHPDLTWVTPSGAHELLVSDIAEPVVAAATRTPFESSRRVFVIERADEMGDEAANRMLKTLEEPPPYVVLLLLTDRLAEVLPTIRSRCQLVRFEPPSVAEVAAGLGIDQAAAEACARLALGDASRASVLAQSGELRDAGERFARAAVAGEVVSARPWVELMGAVRARGEETKRILDKDMAAQLELYPRKEHKRIETEWSERLRRVRRRVETAALDLGLQVTTLWFRDLACLAWGASDEVANCDRTADLAATRAVDPERLREAMELVEETRRRFLFNVTEELACEALAYRLETALS
jgi:DNA polymerase-3 subunit delta'